MNAPTAAPPLVEMRRIRKTYPGVVALDNVGLEVRAGEVHVLVGENGAGKSTLMNVLSGAVRKDAGAILLDGQSVDIKSPRDAQALGIVTIYQEFNLVPHLSAAENICLGREPIRWPGLIDRRRMIADAARLLTELGLRIDPRTPVRELGVAEQQLVEIARALSRRARVLIMDEPTSALTGREVEQLFAVIRRLTWTGAGVIYISHRMEEVFRIGDRATVLRDGTYIVTCRIPDTSVARLVRLMADRELTDHFPVRTATRGDELLRVEGICRGIVRDVSFTLHRGEVLGIAGLLGAGRTALARVLAGADRPEAGRILVKGQDAHLRSPGDAIRRGVGFLPEDRKAQGLIAGLSVQHNVVLPHLGRLSRLGIVDAAAEGRLARQSVDELRIKTPGLRQRVMHLSGGNQQKVVLAKWLAGDAEILIFDEPTRGIDVAAKVEIHHLMNRLAAEGAGIILISSELPEILGMSDRILVMHAGRIRAELGAGEATQARILEAALGLAS